MAPTAQRQVTLMKSSTKQKDEFKRWSGTHPREKEDLDSKKLVNKLIKS
jgi:hypothetical protein